MRKTDEHGFFKKELRIIIRPCNRCDSLGWVCLGIPDLWKQLLYLRSPSYLVCSYDWPAYRTQRFLSCSCNANFIFLAVHLRCCLKRHNVFLTLMRCFLCALDEARIFLWQITFFLMLVKQKAFFTKPFKNKWNYFWAYDNVYHIYSSRVNIWKSHERDAWKSDNIHCVLKSTSMRHKKLHLPF